VGRAVLAVPVVGAQEVLPEKELLQLQVQVGVVAVAATNPEAPVLLA
jgi:hypothetical protein